VPELLNDFLQHEPSVLAVLALLLLTVVILAFAYVSARRAQQALSAQITELEHARAMDRQRNEQADAAMAEQRSLREQAETDREQWRGRATSFENRIASLESENRGLQQKVLELEEDRASQQQRADGVARELSDARIALREQEVTLDKERRATTEKLELLERNRDALKQEFENLANKIFEQKSERFSQQTRTSLDTLLNPFRDQLQDFRKRVEDVYTTETRDRQALRSEIKSLQELNRQITEEASNLTRALKGDKKIQGNWGEVILERVLERSGLRKGIEYDTQGSYRDENNNLLRPDVVVHLPDSRNLVIDSKVSLVAYQQFANEEDDTARAEALRQHIEAVRSHIRGLSEKDYSQLHGLHSPDFVFLFMPIEPAFVAAFQQDENLFAEAFERKIIVVTPSTLLATLRTVENIWRYERQSQNARRIADRAGAVYDKLRVFVEAMEKLGGQLQTAQGSYDNAMNTLTRGRGNLISQANRFVELGVRVKKELPKGIRDQAEVDAEGGDDVGSPRTDDAVGDNQQE
jgi:DNA recombination protein RmuC